MPPFRYAHFRAALKKVCLFALNQSAKIHCPRIGTNCGGNWKNIGEILREELCHKGIGVSCYDVSERK
jgi:hypothetical protein